ncbi:MAG: hypothetical protein ACRDTG_00065 [Pseudonocardiaceae bacterium]
MINPAEVHPPRGELARLLGRKVDLVSKGHLHWVIRDHALAHDRSPRRVARHIG